MDTQTKGILEQHIVLDWNCPLCGNKCHRLEDALDHIVKDHLKEYAEAYYTDKSTTKLFPPY